MSIEKENWLAVFSTWLRQFEMSCDLLGVIPAIPASYILGLYRGGWCPSGAATLLLSWGGET